ncbi:hypothetical protein BH24ACT19_BH24ACT19_22230 [soil metagenome]
MQDARASIAEDLAAFREPVDKMPEDTRGAIIALCGRPVLAEVLPGPHSFDKVFPKLLAGYAFEALENTEDGALPDVSVVEGFLQSISQARAEEHPALGLGQDVRFESEGLSGYALVREEGVLHAAAFATQSIRAYRPITCMKHYGTGISQQCLGKRRGVSEPQPKSGRARALASA